MAEPYGTLLADPVDAVVSLINSYWASIADDA